MNKETHFKEALVDSDYDFMDGLDIKGYSKTELGNLCNIREKITTYHKKEKGIWKAINGLNMAITKTSDPVEKAEKTKLRDGHLNNLVTVTNVVNDCDTYISSREIINYNGQDLALSTNVDCAKIIRNCFAHCGRVHINGRDKSGETLITLTDYDDVNVSGIVNTNLTSLIKFFSHETFKNVMNKTVSVCEKTIKR